MRNSEYFTRVCHRAYLYIPEIPAELGLLIEGITQYEPADRILLDQIIEKLQDFLSIDDS